MLQQPIMQVEHWVLSERVHTTAYQSEQIVGQENVSWDWISVLFIFYLLGVVVHLVMITISLHRLLCIVKEGDKLKKGKYTIVRIPYNIAPFSWNKYIVLSEEDYQSNPYEILEHEEQHLRLRHSIDLFFMECVLTINWFNPAIWLLKRELQDIHEYQADAGVLSKGIDATKYQLLLVKKAIGASRYTLANSFNHSKIKKRITMMLKVQSNKWYRLKPLLLVPVGMIALHAFACPSEEVMAVINPSERIAEEISVSPSESKNTTILWNDKEEQPELSGQEQEKKVAPPPPALPPGERRVIQVIFYYDEEGYKAFDIFENTTQQDINATYDKWWNDKVNKIRINTVSWVTDEKVKSYLDMLSKAEPATGRTLDYKMRKGVIK